MDTLVALGSTTAFSYSAWALLSGAGGHLYFMEAAAIISLISAGHWLEARVSDKASGALKSLLNLAPQTARRKNSTGNENEIPVAELKIGDEIILRPGDRVPVDGIIVEGDSVIDESALTGESIPIDKKIGSELFTGTVNLNGRLAIDVYKRQRLLTLIMDVKFFVLDGMSVFSIGEARHDPICHARHEQAGPKHDGCDDRHTYE